MIEKLATILATLLVGAITATASPTPDPYPQDPWVIVATQDGKVNTIFSQDTANAQVGTGITTLKLIVTGPNKGQYSTAFQVTATAEVWFGYPKLAPNLAMTAPAKAPLSQDVYIEDPWSEQKPPIIFHHLAPQVIPFKQTVGTVALTIAGGVVTAQGDPDEQVADSIIPRRMNALRAWHFEVMRLGAAIDYANSLEEE